LVFGFLGCMAQSRGRELVEGIPHVDLVVGTQKFHKVADYVDALLGRRLAGSAGMDDVRSTIVDTGEETGSQDTIRDHVLEPRQATAFVSIMQGCNMHCAFCIVPATRGAERSRPISEIVTEVEGLAARGVKEVTLLGQIVNLYGRHEFPRVGAKSPFVQLLDAVHAVDGIRRIRFTSPHPVGFRDDLVGCYRDLPKLVEHVHLPVQSGSDRVLRAMRRPYTSDRYRRLIDALRSAEPDLAITTDIIVGFPGETEADHAETCRLAEEVGFDNAFVFRYSPRRDTPAAELGDQLPESVKAGRNQDLLRIVERSATQRMQGFVGQTVEILCEGPSKNNPDRLSGRTRTNKIVVFEGDDRRHVGEIFEVQVERATPWTLYATAAVLA